MVDQELLSRAALTVLVVAGLGGGIYSLALLREEEPEDYAAQIAVVAMLSLMLVAVYIMMQGGELIQ